MTALEQIIGQMRCWTPTLMQGSLRKRLPYIDPLKHLQVELLRRYGDGANDESTRSGLDMSINGIAAGLRNSG